MLKVCARRNSTIILPCNSVQQIENMSMQNSTSWAGCGADWVERPFYVMQCLRRKCKNRFVIELNMLLFYLYSNEKS